VLRTGTIIESLFDENRNPQCRFVVAEPNQPPFEADEYSISGITHYPPERTAKFFQTGIVTLASSLEDYGTTTQLFDSIKAFLRSYLDLSEFHIALLAHWAVMTWIFQAFRAFPYLGFRGQPGCGKSRALQVMGSICYRSVDTGNLTTKSALFRYNDQFRSTMLLDESDHLGDLRSDFFKLINAGYQTHGTVSLSVLKGDEWVPESYSVGSPKILCNRLEFPDKATETRVLVIPMISKPLADHVPSELPFRFEAEAQSLRNQLMKWRLDQFHRIHKQDAALKGLDGRAQQLGLPIYSISPDPAFKAEFLRYLKARSKELREDDPLLVTLEAILKVYTPKSGDGVSLSRIREEARTLAREREIPDYEFTAKRTANLVRSLTFKTAKWGVGVMVFLDETTLEMQAKRFGLPGPKSKQVTVVTVPENG
jgi:hypothetical protein